MREYTATPLLDRRFMLGEGPVWLAETQQLMWVDIKTGSLFTCGPEGNTLAETQVGQYLGAAVPAAGGGTVLAMATGVYHLGENGLRPVCRPAALAPNQRLNDAKCDPRGRLLFGTISLFDMAHEPGALFCLEADATCRTLLEEVGISNGLAWSADGKILYFNDTATGGVDAFDYDLETAALSNRRRVYTALAGKPDGMCIDDEGMLWVALWGGGQVLRVDPATGKAVACVPLPCQNVTSCCFGGKDMGILFITTSGEGYAEAAAGRVYTVRPGVRGPKPVYYAGAAGHP